MAKSANAVDLDREFEAHLGDAGIRTIIDWVAARSLWVHPEAVRRVPVVFPQTRRKRHDEKRGDIIDGLRVGTNVPAQEAFWTARGESGKDYRNQYVCHLYDASPYLPLHNTHLANLCVFPRGIQSMSEWAPVQAVLHWHAYQLYGYTGPEEEPPTEPAYYPTLWPGIAQHEPKDLESIVLRLEHLRATRPMHTNPSATPGHKGSPVQDAVLEVLREAPNGVTQAEVCAMVNKPDGQVNPILRLFIERGKAERREDPRKPSRYLYFAKDAELHEED